MMDLALGLGFLSVLTAAIATFAGMGGGVLLFAVMGSFLSLSIVVPVHGLVQFIANSHRCFILRKHLRFEMIKPFVPGAILGAVASRYLLSTGINESIPLCLLVILILYTLFKPAHFSLPLPRGKGFFWLGLATGGLGMLVGAVDPILAPFFVRDDIDRHEIVANKTALQVIVHALKLPVFLSLGFEYGAHINLIIFLVIGSLIGNKLGYSLLQYMTAKMFRGIFKFALLGVAIKISYQVLQGV